MTRVPVRLSQNVATPVSSIETGRSIAGLQRAAKLCHEMVIYESKYDVDTVPFLDYDVIRRSLPTYAAVEMTAQAIKNDDIAEPMRWVQHLTGPSALTYFTSELADQYFLPPGTLAELKQTELDLIDIGKKSTSEMLPFDKPESLATMSDYSSKIWRDTQSGDLLENAVGALEKYINAQSDRQTIQKIISNSVSPSDMLPSVLGGEVESMAIKISKHLNSRRPQFTRNNWHDAFNLAVLELVYQRLIHKQDSQGLLQCFPTLITGTGIVREEANRIWRRTPAEKQTPRICAQTGVLGLFATLPTQYGAKRNRQADFDSSKMLAKDALKLQSNYNDFERLLLSAGGSTSMPIHELEDLDEELLYSWEVLSEDVRGFVDEWGTVLAPIADQKAFDRATLIDRLSVRYLLPLMDSRGDKEKIIKYSTMLRREIAAVVHKNDNLVDMLTNVGRTVASSDFVEISSAVNKPAFLLSLDAKARPPLRNASFSKPLEMFEDMKWSQPHDYRVLAHHEHYRKRGAVIAFDSVREGRGENRYIRIVWTHDLDSLSVWSEGTKYCRAQQTDAQTTYTLHIQGELYEGNIDDNQEDQGMRLWNRYEEWSLFEIEKGELTFFAHTRPIGQYEKQIGVIMPASYWEEKEIFEIGKLISRVLGGDEDMTATWASLLNEISVKLGLISPEVVTEQHYAIYE